MSAMALRFRRDKLLTVQIPEGATAEVIGCVSDQEFESLFGFFPRVDIKLTPQQDEKLCAYIKRRDGKQ